MKRDGEYTEVVARVVAACAQTNKDGINAVGTSYDFGQTWLQELTTRKK